jgi:hypothetical protein
LSSSPSLHGFNVGDIFSFRTTPIPRSSKYDTHRFAALKIIAITGRRLFWVVFDGTFDVHPTIEQVASLPWLRNTRLAFKNDPACRWSEPGEFHPPELGRIGSLPVTADDLALATGLRPFGPMNGAAVDAEGEWRWRNDRQAFVKEVEEDVRADRERREEAERRRKERQLQLTWDALRQQRFFDRWEPSPPFPPEAFVKAARERLQTTISELRAMGEKPRRTQVRKCIKSTVEWFNAKDAEFGHVIETEEREDICLLLEDIVCVARQPSIADEIGEWRTW